MITFYRIFFIKIVYILLMEIRIFELVKIYKVNYNIIYYMHRCDLCKKDFRYKYLLDKHKLRKRVCNTSDNIIKNYTEKIDEIEKYIENKTNDSIENGNKCLFCDKEFSNKANTKKHISSTCIVIKQLNTQKIGFEQEKNNFIDKQKIKEKDNEIQKLRDTMEKMIMKQNTPSINITNNNKVINNNLIVNINNFGKEDLSHITLNDYKKYLSGFFPGFIKFIEKVHFDENAPENHNINITNMKSKYLHIYEDNKWTLKEKVDVIDKFINKKYTMLVDKCEELEEKNEISEKIIDDFVQFTQNYKDQEAQKNTKNKISTLIYNKRDKINMK